MCKSFLKKISQLLKSIQINCSQIFHIAVSENVVLCTVCLLIIVSLISIQIPLSLFYRTFHNDEQNLNLAKMINTARYNQASNYFNNRKNDSDDLLFGVESPSGPLVVCIITVARSSMSDHDTKGYLLQTAASFDHLVKNDHFFPNTKLFICNVENPPNTHKEAQFLTKYISYLERYGSNSFNRAFPRVTGFVQRHMNLARSKEMEDYIYCLNASHTFKSPYVLMVEDDIIANKNLFEVLHYSLNSHTFNQKTLNSENERRKLSFLKVYFPLRWQGYGFELDRVMELISVGFLGGALLLLYKSILYKIYRTNVDNSIRFFNFCWGTVVMILIVYVVGRQNIIELRRLSPQLYRFGHSPDCCTPAMLYPDYAIPGLIKYLLEHSEFNKDLAIANFSRSINTPGFQLEPNLVHHIGMYSSLQNTYKPPEEMVLQVPLY